MALESLSLKPDINLGIHYGEGLAAILGMNLKQYECNLN